MKTIQTIVFGMLVMIGSTALAVEFPGSKEEQKFVAVMNNGKVFAEVKIMAPAIIDAIGSDVSISSQPGNKHTLKIKDGSVEIRPENGKPVKITGELIYVYGYGKPEKK